MTVASVLALILLAIAAWTIVARQTFAAVVGFVAYGLLLSIAWVALRAIDVALTEAAIDGGLTGMRSSRAIGIHGFSRNAQTRNEKRSSSVICF